jgi:16S rRNA (adenine1518-N6/adenine1519-N6)-dimethyltransferase
MKHQFKKRFGQNFLRDENLLKKIVSSANLKGETVIEIGPGMGALTKYIVKDASFLYAYELDTTLKHHLSMIFQNEQNINILFEDFLDANLSVYQGDISVIGNIPYNITSPIIFKLLEVSNVKKIVLMVQKEVGDRIVASPNTKAYNALSVIIQTHYDVKKITDVNKKMFYPIPKVDSVVIQMIKKENVNHNFHAFVKACFKQKRKTLANNLLEAGISNKETLYEQLNLLSYSNDVRAEAIKQKDFIHLFNHFNIL